MEKFFRVNDVLVDVERGYIIDNRIGKQIELDLVGCTIKDFANRVKLNPLRISVENNKPTAMWWNDKLHCWMKFEKTHNPDVNKAIQKYINIKFEEDLLG